MPVIQSSKRERHPIPAGDHILTLVEVKPHESDNPFYDPKEPEGGANQKRKTRLIWQFLSDSEDAEGTRYEHAIWTGEYYGHQRAGLTALLDQMLPDADEQVKSAINTDTLLGSRYKAKIRLAKNQKGDLVPKAVDLEPIKGDKAVQFDPDDQGPGEYPATGNAGATNETPF